MELIVAKCNAKFDVDIILKFLENKLVIRILFHLYGDWGSKDRISGYRDFFFHLIKTIFQEIEVV